jgi:hypothetical protein
MAIFKMMELPLPAFEDLPDSDRYESHAILV